MRKLEKAWCDECYRYRCGERVSPHVLAHSLMLVISFGLWLPIWLHVIFKPHYRCRFCGSRII